MLFYWFQLAARRSRQRPDGIAFGWGGCSGSEGSEEAESAQLKAMSHPGTRISSLTKTHRHQRDEVGLSGWTRGRSANTPPHRRAELPLQT